MAHSPIQDFITLNVEYDLIAMERILIFLSCCGPSLITALGLLLTSILAVTRFIYHRPPSKASMMFDGVFWVERVGCVLLLCVLLRRRFKRGWYNYEECYWLAAICLLSITCAIRVHRTEHYWWILSFRLQNHKPTPTRPSEIKLKKKTVAEIGTQTEKDAPSLRAPNDPNKSEIKVEVGHKGETKLEELRIEELEQQIHSTTTECKNLRERSKEERSKWKKKRKNYVNTIRSYKKEIQNLEAESAVLLRHLTKATEETVKLKTMMEPEIIESKEMSKKLKGQEESVMKECKSQNQLEEINLIQW